MDEKELRSFLVKEPRGAKIVIRTADDEVQEVRGPGPGSKGGSSWAHVARSILALDPVLIELQAEDGSLIRAAKCTDAVAATPAGEANLPVLHTDPETARLTHFANLLYRATEFSTTLAFSKMVELFQMSASRSEAIEARLERTEANYRREMQARLDDAFDRADEEREEAERIAKEGAASAAGDPVTAFVQNFAAAQRQNVPPPPAPNGKAKQ